MHCSVGHSITCVDVAETVAVEEREEGRADCSGVSMSEPKRDPAVRYHWNVSKGFGWESI